MLYFAYGSNMLRERLLARVPGAKWLGVAHCDGRQLEFHKKSIDGSGKCDIPQTGNNADKVYGVLYDVPRSQKPDLDEAEGLGQGYNDEKIEVQFHDGQTKSAIAYFASPDAKKSGLIPYDWYLCLVLEGAKQNGLPDGYIASIAGVKAIPDPKPGRKTRIEALEALRKAGISCFDKKDASAG
jgi:gamma-glutamylcyclotransferase